MNWILTKIYLSLVVIHHNIFQGCIPNPHYIFQRICLVPKYQRSHAIEGNTKRQHPGSCKITTKLSKIERRKSEGKIVLVTTHHLADRVSTTEGCSNDTKALLHGVSASSVLFLNFQERSWASVQEHNRLCFGLQA